MLRTVWYLSDSTKFHEANSCGVGKLCISGIWYFTVALEFYNIFQIKG